MSSPGSGKTSTIIHTIQNLSKDLKIFPISAKTGEGIEAWCDWLREEVEELGAVKCFLRKSSP